MAHAAATFRVPTGVLFIALAIGVLTTVPGWGESRLGDDHPFGFPPVVLVRFALAAGLVALAGRQISVVKRLRLEETEIARMRQELVFARGTQERFLPQSLPVVPGLDLWGANMSSNEVSGDYYDIRDAGDARPLMLAIADVAGKGVPAALLMSAVQAGLHSHLLQGGFDLERTMQNLNRLVHQDAQAGRFVTMVVAEFDKATRSLRYVRAGHDYPLVISRDGNVRRLSEGDVFLGLLPQVEYRAATADLFPGDTLCFYTDGVTEATDASGELFDEERLVEVLVRHRSEPAAAIGRAVLEAVSAHSGLPRQADDATLVILKIACAGQPAFGTEERGALAPRLGTARNSLLPDPETPDTMPASLPPTHGLTRTGRTLFDPHRSHTPACARSQLSS